MDVLKQKQVVRKCQICIFTALEVASVYQQFAVVLAVRRFTKIQGDFLVSKAKYTGDFESSKNAYLTFAHNVFF